MKTIIILTGNEIRHTFVRKYLCNCQGINVLKTYCEDANPERIIKGESNSQLRENHLQARKQTELDFFENFISKTPDNSNYKIIQRGEINQDSIIEEIKQLNPDLIISYGCSIVKESLINSFPQRFINLHLGLSPYYRGSGTNFWPLVNEEPGFVGTTFMYIDKGIDTGQIIHQVRADIYPLDNLHIIGNRLISKATQELERLIILFDQLEPIPCDYFPEFEEKYYKNIDFNEHSVEKVYTNFKSGLIENYLKQKSEFEKKYPIYINPGLNC